VDSRFRGNDDIQDTRLRHRHFRESGNPSRLSCHGFFHRVEARKQRVESGLPEELADGGGEVGQPQEAAPFLKFFTDNEQAAKPRAADVLDAAKIKNHELFRATHDLRAGLLEARRGFRVDASAHLDYGRRTFLPR
jgi:hypothetical protein